MVDTLKLRLAEFEILPENKLTFRPAARPLGAHLQQEPAGAHLQRAPEDVRRFRIAPGATAYYNRKGHRPFEVTVCHPLRRDLRRPSTDLCYVTLSVPKFVAGSNLSAVDRDTTAWAMRKLEKKLLRVGIKTDIMKAVVARLDCFANVATDERFHLYHPLFRGLRLPRAVLVTYPTYYLWRNTQYEVGIYDKIAEATHRGERIVNSSRGLMRFEYRLLVARRVFSTLEITTVRSLLNEYDRVREHFKRELQKYIFPQEVKGLERAAGSQLDKVFRTFKEMPNFGRDKFVYACGCRYLENHIGQAGAKEMLTGGDGPDVRRKCSRKFDELLAKFKQHRRGIRLQEAH